MIDPKELIFYLTPSLVLLGLLLSYSVQKYNKQKDAVDQAEDRQKELELAKQELRDHAEKILADHCEKSDKILNNIFEDVAEIRIRLSVVETRNEFVYSYLEKSIATILKSPNHPEKDILLSHMAKGDLSLEEAEKLRNIFDHEKDIPENKGYLWAYIGGIVLLDDRITKLRKGLIANE
jgi:hypothetical protein